MKTRLKKTILKLLSVLLFFALIFSCIERELTELKLISGNFLIEKIIEGDEEVTRETLMQSIYFKPDGTCRFPFLNSSGLRWEYIENEGNGRKLVLTRNQSSFKREYDLIFKVDERNLLQVELTNDEQYILLTRLLFYPKDRPEFIRELINGN